MVILLNLGYGMTIQIRKIRSFRGFFFLLNEFKESNKVSYEILCNCELILGPWICFQEMQ